MGSPSIAGIPKDNTIYLDEVETKLDEIKTKLDLLLKESDLNLDVDKDLQVDIKNTTVDGVETALTGTEKSLLTKSVITGKNPTGNYIIFEATAGGNFKTSLQELDNAVKSNGGLKVSILDTTGTHILPMLNSNTSRSVSNFPSDFPDSATHTKLDTLNGKVATETTLATLMLNSNTSRTVSNFPSDYPDSTAQTKLQTLIDKNQKVNYTYTSNSTVTVASTSTSIIASGTAGVFRAVTIRVPPTADTGVHINFGASATTSDYLLSVGEEKTFFTDQAINGIRAGSTDVGVYVYTAS